MRTLLAASTAALLLAVPGAQAKGISSVEVCGVEGCHQVAKPSHRMLETNGSTVAPKAAAPFYRVRFSINSGPESDHFSNEIVLSLGLQRTLDETGAPLWYEIAGDVLASYRKAARGLTAFPASKIGAIKPRKPEAQVSEVFSPAGSPTGGSGGSGGSRSGSGDGIAWPLAALLVGGAALIAGAGARTLTRRRRAERDPATA